MLPLRNTYFKLTSRQQSMTMAVSACHCLWSIWFGTPDFLACLPAADSGSAARAAKPTRARSRVAGGKLTLNAAALPPWTRRPLRRERPFAAPFVTRSPCTRAETSRVAALHQPRTRHRKCSARGAAGPAVPEARRLDVGDRG